MALPKRGGLRSLPSSTLIALLATSACGGPDRLPSPAHIAVEEPTYNAGRVSQGTSINHSFEFRNDGDVDLRINQVRTSCGCMTGTANLSVIHPGERGSIEVTFNTTSYFGSVERTTTVLTNDGSKPVTQLKIRADIDFDVAIDPPEIYVGRVKRGATVRNFPRVLIGEGHEVDVRALESGEKVVTATWADLSGSARERRLQLAIRPDAPAGEFRESILVRTDSSARPVVAVPVVGIVEEATERLLSDRG